MGKAHLLAMALETRVEKLCSSNPPWVAARAGIPKSLLWQLVRRRSLMFLLVAMFYQERTLMLPFKTKSTSKGGVGFHGIADNLWGGFCKDPEEELV
jgi:hypothetical protein